MGAVAGRVGVYKWTVGAQARRVGSQLQQLLLQLLLSVTWRNAGRVLTFFQPYNFLIIRHFTAP